MEYIGRIENDKKLYMGKEPIVIFGAGRGLNELLDKMKQLDIENRIVCICDSDTNRWNMEVSGIKICSLDYALKHYSNAIYIVYNRFFIDISKQLNDKEVERVHLLRLW